jgi:hypothetical protein
MSEHSNTEAIVGNPGTLDLVVDRELCTPSAIDAVELMHHTIILAQSGAGKSSTLGRLIEEIALKTRARVVILDPNSDFVRITEVDNSVWERKSLRRWLTHDDTREGFAASWNSVPIAVASNQDLPSVRRLAIDWGSLSDHQMAAAMGIDARHEPSLYWCTSICRNIARQHWSDEEALFDFDHYRGWSNALVEYLSGPATTQEPVFDGTFAETLRHSVGGEVALRYAALVSSVAEHDIWRRRGDGQPDIGDLAAADGTPRVLVVDVQSLKTDDERISVSMRVLASVWERARLKYFEAIRHSRKPDERVPTFVVIDEAHNLVPASPQSPGIRELSSRIIRIAVEGRKYGIFLVVATQRPRAIDPGVLSQCDNLLLMRFRNGKDLSYVSDTLGYAIREQMSEAATFGAGDILHYGSVGNSGSVLHVLPRRTVQGGRGISSEYWLNQ